MAAVAKTTTPLSDGRFPCPHCGGLVHPIAGRCKHCRADLNEVRGARPQAAAALPALAGTGKAPIRADATPVPSKLAARASVANDPSEPILPPRESMRMPAQNAKGGSLLRNWPVIVIVLAGLAIAAAVVIMVWPASKDAKADTRLPPPPAPERMNTDPLSPQGSLTPPSAPKAPAAPNAADPWSKPDDPIDPADPSKDPMRNMFGNVTGNLGMWMTGLTHACSRLVACGNSQAAPLCATMSTTMSQALGAMPMPSCAAAQQCIDKIDQLDCSATLSTQADMMAAITTLQPCLEAMQCS